MNPLIPRLLRICYATNAIRSRQEFLLAHPNTNLDKIQSKDDFLDELSLPLYEEKDGKRRALNGKYVGRVFKDISIRTGIDMSEPNLKKRIMGMTGDVDTYIPAKIYRDALARYTGCKSWESLNMDVERLCDAMEYNIACPYSKEFELVPHCKEIIKSGDIVRGDIIVFSMHENTSLTLQYQGDNKYLVTDSKTIIVKKGDVLKITVPFIIGNRIYASEVYRKDEKLGEWLCRHGIIMFKVIECEAHKRSREKNSVLMLMQFEENKRRREEEEKKNPSTSLHESYKKRREEQEEARRQKQIAKIREKSVKRKAKNAQVRIDNFPGNAENHRTFAPMKENNMNKEERVMGKVKSVKSKKLSVMGAGSMCFDTIIQREYPDGFVKGKKNKFVDKIVMEEIGSNPGNVMCILGYYGWDSYPIGMFDRYPQGLQMTKDFERYHCNTRFVTNTDDGGTNCFSIIHCLDDETGEPMMKHSKKHAPFSGFPHDKGLTVKGDDATLPKFIDSLDGFLPDVYFFSGSNAGWRELGKYMHSKGVLVYFEVQSMNIEELPSYIKCMKESDIVKFSDETINRLGFVDELKDKLVIQTLGAKGARFNLFGQGWVSIDPVPNDNVVDTEGCGDWTTASFINALGQRGVLKLSDMTKDVVRECLAEAQEYASRNVSFMGTKGIIADDKDFHLAKSDYVDTIMAEMDGHIGIKKEKITSLNAIPEKDIMVYDAKDCLIYRSDYEFLNGVERVFDKKKDGVSVMSNFYPCKLPYTYQGKDIVFNSAEQAYHFFRYKEFPLVQWMIMQQKGANDVKSACNGFKYVDSDHEKTRWMYMTLIEELKYLYCKEFRNRIQNLGDTILVESSGSDDIFGSAIPGDAKKAVAYAQKHGIDLTGKYIGMNGCGRCIMAVREKFRGWTEEQLNEYTPNPDINVWWEGSPAYKELIEGMGKDI